MKFTINILLAIILCSCKQTSDNSKLFILDSKLEDTIKQHVQLVSDRYFSQFWTPIDVRYISNNLTTDSTIKTNFEMTSWYSNRNDTIDLVAHFGEFETFALVLRFINRQPNVFYYRSSHSGQNYFRRNNVDTFTNRLEIPPARYRLLLSQIPDTVNKSVVYGQIDMESLGYFDKRDTLQEEKAIKMKFYFRSQFKKFNY